MSDIRFNRWLHQSGTGGVSQDSSGNIGIGSTQPLSALDLGTGNIRSHNIHSTGIVTTTGLDINGNADISGNLNVGGVLTYEDVTNIDSVGVVTARSGINVTGGSVGINSTVPSEKLDVVGNIKSTGTINNLTVGYGPGNQATNTALGRQALNSNTTGTSNVAIGYQSLLNNDSGLNNTGFGYGSLKANTSGDYNIGLGIFSAQNIQTGNNNVALGANALNNLVSGSSNVAIGYYAARYLTGSNNTILGAYQGTGSETSISNTVIISAGTAERLRIDSSGRLLVGATVEGAPAADNLTLEDSGSCGLTIRAGTSDYSTIYLSDATSGVGEYAGSLQYGHADNSLRIGTNSVERLRITSDGNFGINEATPDSKLDIVHSTATNTATENLIHLRTDPSGSYASRGLFIKIGRDGPYDNSGAHYDIVGSAGNSGFHAFEVQGSEKLRITKDGKVGINNTNPTYALSINGTGAVRNEIVCTDNNGAGAGVYFRTMNGGSMVSNATIRTDNAGNLQIFSGATTDAETFRINSTGVVKFGGQSYATATKSGGLPVGNSCYFDITGSAFVFVKVMIKVGYSGNATYTMHAQYDYVTCNYYTTGSTATRTDILQVEAANAQFNYSDISITRPSNRTVRVIYAPTSGAGTHHPIVYVSGIFDSLSDGY